MLISLDDHLRCDQIVVAIFSQYFIAFVVELGGLIFAGDQMELAELQIELDLLVNECRLLSIYQYSNGMDCCRWQRQEVDRHITNPYQHVVLSLGGLVVAFQ